MSVEFGATDEDASLPSRVTGISILAAVRLVNLVSSDSSYRYRPEKAVLAISGESEDSGDAFIRGMNADAITTIAMFVPIVAMVLLSALGSAAIGLFGQAAAMPFACGLFGLLLFSFVNCAGLYTLLDEISVVDHTTEPTPDALNDIKQRYQNGEIDEEELEREAAEVWER